MSSLNFLHSSNIFYICNTKRISSTISLKTLEVFKLNMHVFCLTYKIYRTHYYVLISFVHDVNSVKEIFILDEYGMCYCF